MKIAIIGGGAAGFFGAIKAAENNPKAEVYLLEKTSKLLSKVRISGGGRCNVTHACFDNNLLVQNYPRGMRELRAAFEQFSTTHTIEWFKKRGVKLKTEADGRMFPVTDNSETIAQCLLDAASSAGVKILLNTGVNKIIPQENNGFDVELQSGKTMFFHRILVAAGGGPKAHFFDWLKELGHNIISPVPSLFTFNLPKHPLNELPGISVENVN
ncbi:MAG: aminoacetone oxidase family FAD-binding enzyme, partial [Sphingobacteriales bacterium]